MRDRQEARLKTFTMDAKNITINSNILLLLFVYKNVVESCVYNIVEPLSSISKVSKKHSPMNIQKKILKIDQKALTSFYTDFMQDII